MKHPVPFHTGLIRTISGYRHVDINSCYGFSKQLFFLTSCLIALMAFVPNPAITQTTGLPSVTGSLSAEEIIDRAVVRSENQHLSLIEANFKSEAVSKNQSLGGDGTISKTEIYRYRQYPLNGAVFEELIEIDGRPLNEKEARKEERRRQDFIREVDDRKTRGDHAQPTKDEAIQFNREFTERYLYKFEKKEMLREYPCWVISFEPKQGKLPTKNRMDRALNQTTGLIWVSQDDYGIVRVEFALRKPFKYWGGFLAVVRNTDGNVDYTRVEPNVWLPGHFDLKLDLKVMMVKNVRRLITKDWYDYTRVNQPFVSDPSTISSVLK